MMDNVSSVQLYGYKGVISHLSTEKALSNRFSLWAVQNVNHVFGQSLILIWDVLLIPDYRSVSAKGQAENNKIND